MVVVGGFPDVAECGGLLTTCQPSSATAEPRI
jgi:hypothetical protein